MTEQLSTFCLPSIRAMLDGVFAALPIDPKRDPEDVRLQRESAEAALLTLAPKDALEAEMAVRIVAAHFAAMDSFKRAAQPDVPDAMAIRLRSSAVALSRMADSMSDALLRRHGTSSATRRTAVENRHTSDPATPQGSMARTSGKDPMPSERLAASPPLNRHERRLAAAQADRATRLQALGGRRDVTVPPGLPAVAMP